MSDTLVWFRAFKVDICAVETMPVKKQQFQIKSNESKRKKWQRLSCDEKTWILLLKSDGANISQISRFIQCSRPCVTKIIEKFSKHQTIKNFIRHNYPSVLSPVRVKNLIDFAKRRENRHKSITEIQSELQLPCSKATICRLLRAYRLKSRTARKVFILSPNHKEKRLQFASEYLEVDNNFWDSVVFTDEKSVQNYCNGQMKIRCVSKEDATVYQDKSRRLRVNLWAFISMRGIAIFKVDSKFNSKKYLQMLLSSGLPEIERLYGKDYHFLQDNAPLHKSKKSMRFFRRQNIKLVPFPARSPDLNCIENFWGLLQKNVNR